MLNRFIPHIILFCLGIIIGAGVYHKYFKPEPLGETVVAEHENESSNQVVEKVVITKPSGTKIVRDTRTITNTRTVTKEVTKTVFRPKNKYTLGTSWSFRPDHRSDFSLDRLKRPVIDVGYRLGESPLFVTTGYDFDREGVIVGVRFEF